MIAWTGTYALPRRRPRSRSSCGCTARARPCRSGRDMQSRPRSPSPSTARMCASRFPACRRTSSSTDPCTARSSRARSGRARCAGRSRSTAVSRGSCSCSAPTEARRRRRCRHRGRRAAADADRVSVRRDPRDRRVAHRRQAPRRHAAATASIVTDATGFTWNGTHYTRLSLRQREVRVGVDAATLSAAARRRPVPRRRDGARLRPAHARRVRHLLRVLRAERLRRARRRQARHRRVAAGRFPATRRPGTVDLLAHDAQAEVRFLAKLPQVDPEARRPLRRQPGRLDLGARRAREPGACTGSISNSGPTATVGETDYWGSLAGQSESPPSGTRAQMLARGAEGTGRPASIRCPSLRKLAIPALWMFGADDRNVPTELCVAAARSAEAGPRLQLGRAADRPHAARAADRPPVEPAAVARLRPGLLPRGRRLAPKPQHRRVVPSPRDGAGCGGGSRASPGPRRGPRGRRPRRAGAARALPLDGAAAHLRRALRHLSPPGPHRHVRDLLESRGDAGRRRARARRRGLDLPELPRVGDRALARHAAEDRAELVARASRGLVEPGRLQRRLDLRADRDAGAARCRARVGQEAEGRARVRARRSSATARRARARSTRARTSPA